MKTITLKQNLIGRIKINNLYKKHGFSFDIININDTDNFIISVNDQLIYVSKDDIWVNIRWGNLKTFLPTIKQSVLIMPNLFLIVIVRKLLFILLT